MAVKRCPRCGDLFLAAVDVCADCDVPLVDVAEEPRVTADDGSAVSALSTDRDAWELHAWTMEGRRLLDGMLDTADIARAWQGTTLVTPAVAHDLVAEMVADVSRSDARVGLDDDELAAADAPDTSGGDDTVGYEVADWDDGALDQLTKLLDRDSVPYAWDDDGDLVVSAAHEATADAIFTELAGDGDDDAADDEDGLAVQETLSDLFIAADRLMRHPLDGTSAQLLFRAASRAAGFSLPFGFPPPVWTSIVERSEALSARFEPGTLDDEAIQADAAALRALLREYV